jgi:hypothetical protein
LAAVLPGEFDEELVPAVRGKELSEDKTTPAAKEICAGGPSR